MMHYDVAVIGGGIAGYSAALRALQAGKKVVLINQGQSALHFSSGSIDVLGRLPDGSVVNQPFDALSALQQQAPEHPYSKVGRKNSEKRFDVVQTYFRQCARPFASRTRWGQPLAHYPTWHPKKYLAVAAFCLPLSW